MSAAPTSPCGPAAGYDPALGVPPPRLRRGTVRRDRLVRMLVQSADVPLVLVRAPAGYGKTTLLCQWSERDERPFVWAGPGEPALELAAARSTRWTGRRSSCSTARACAGTSPRRRPSSALSRRVAGRARRPRRARAAAREPARAGPGDRGRPGGARDDAPRGRRDAQHGGRRARARRPRRAAAPHGGLARGAVPRRAVAARRAATRTARSRGFAGDDRLVADYLRDEVLPAPAAEASFLHPHVGPRRGSPARPATRCSTPPARARCCATSSAGHPARAARPRPTSSTATTRCWARCSGPSCAGASRVRSAELHRRAGAWHEHEGDVAPALEHAIEAGDIARRRVAACGRSRAPASRAAASTRCTGWLDRFRPEQLVRRADARADGRRRAPRRRRPRPRRALARDGRTAARGRAGPAARRPRPRRRCARWSRATGWRRWRSDAARALRARARGRRRGGRSRCLLRGAGLHLLGDRDAARGRCSRRARAAAASSRRSPRCSASPSSR